MVHSDRFTWGDEPGSEMSLCWSGAEADRGLGNLLLKAPVDDTRTQPHFSSEMHRLPEQRRQLIFRIRRQIAEGNYESEKKLELAFDRMFDSILDDTPPSR